MDVKLFVERMVKSRDIEWNEELFNEINKKFDISDDVERAVVILTEYLRAIRKPIILISEIARELLIGKNEVYKIIKKHGVLYFVDYAGRVKRDFGDKGLELYNKIVSKNYATPPVAIATVAYLLTGDKKTAIAKKYCITDVAIRKVVNKLKGEIDGECGSGTGNDEHKGN